MASPTEQRQLERLILERDLVVSRIVDVVAGDTIVRFNISTLSAETKIEARKDADRRFPAPPVIRVTTPFGQMAKFDLEDETYRKEIKSWDKDLTTAIFAATLDLNPEQVGELESIFDYSFLSQLFGTVELVNGIQSDPLAELIKEAVWAPEVLAWMETYSPAGDADVLTITDTPMFREIDCVIDAGLTLDVWANMSSRMKLLYMAHFDAKNFRDAYVNWHQSERTKKLTAGAGINRHIK